MECIHQETGGEMKRFSAYVLLALMSTCLFVSCVSKKQWQGKYTTVSYTKIEPKEDFKVWEYVVIAYDVGAVDKHSGVIYRFAIMLNDEKFGALEVCDTSQDMFGYLGAEGYEYVLLAGDVESAHDYGHGQPFVVRQMHRKYKTIPTYENVKNDVIDVLSSE